MTDRSRDELDSARPEWAGDYASYPFITVDVEKRDGAGEDAAPIAEYLGAGWYLLAVFDGMGGKGAEEYATFEGRQSGARIAARVSRNATLEWFRYDEINHTLEALVAGKSISELVRSYVSGSESGFGELIVTYAAFLRYKLDATAEALHIDPPRLRGDMFKLLPTTVAGCLVYAPEQGASECLLLPFWAGDSRVYSLSVNQGLQQLTGDHLKVESDAQRNLTEDAVLSNYARAYEEFSLSFGLSSTSGPSVVLAATDGCFDYVPSPAVFEELLIGSARSEPGSESRGADWISWQNRLTAALRVRANDDIALAAVPLGFESASHVVRAFQQRHEDLARLLAPVHTAERRVPLLQDEVAAARVRLREAEQQVDAARREVSRAADAVWAVYQPNYESGGVVESRASCRVDVAIDWGTSVTRPEATHEETPEGDRPPPSRVEEVAPSHSAPQGSAESPVEDISDPFAPGSPPSSGTGWRPW